jgi:hypothetical protein
MRDPKRFGRSLAERMVIRMRNNIDAQQALRRMASEVAGTANTMVLAEGKQREDVATSISAGSGSCRTSLYMARRLRPIRSCA